LILNTRRLFCRLLRTLEIKTVCDVGSMDGSDALLFRRFLPGAQVIALEPHPVNFALMQADERLARNGIRILPFAASDRHCEAQFFVVRADHSTTRDRTWRGMSSLHRRPDPAWLADIVQVQTVRLDELLTADALDGGPIALWIDTEGTSFEVIRGASGVTNAASLIHVEVETKAIIGANQRLFADVEKVLIDAGFTLLATDQPQQCLQFNALFVRTELLSTKTREILFWVNSLRLRRIVTQRLSRLLPSKLRRTLAALGCTGSV